MVSQTQIRELSQRIVQEFHPARVILCGSHAAGIPHCDSDVDILVVMPHSGKNWRMAATIRGAVHSSFPLDLLVRQPDEMRQRIAGGDPFLRAVEETGEVLYESHNS